MNVGIVCVGKLKETYLRDALAEYQKRLGRYCRLQITEVAESKNTSRAPADVANACKEEGKRLLGHLSGTVVVLDLSGREVTSEQIAAIVKETQDRGGEIDFVVGGSDGLSEEVLRRADHVIRFGRITLPHQLCRVVLAEQIYRAFCINAGVPYHK